MKQSTIQRLLDWRKLHPEHNQQRLEGVKNSKKIKEALKENYSKNKEKAIKNRAAHPKMQSGPQHFSSKYFHIRDPSGKKYFFKGLTHFIRTNENLFNPEDVVWAHGRNRKGKTSMCRALSGISSLQSKSKPVGSWKGWTLVSQEEIFFNNGKDLLDREIIRDCPKNHS